MSTSFDAFVAVMFPAAVIFKALVNVGAPTIAPETLTPAPELLKLMTEASTKLLTPPLPICMAPVVDTVIFPTAEIASVVKPPPLLVIETALKLSVPESPELF